MINKAYGPTWSIAIVLLIGMVVGSCNRLDNGGDEEPKKPTRKDLMDAKEEAAKALATQVGAKVLLDTFHLGYSFQFDQYMGVDAFVRDPEILDIYTVKGKTYLSILVDDFSERRGELVLTLLVDSTDRAELLQTVASINSGMPLDWIESRFDRPYMATVKVHELRKADMIFKSEVGDFDVEEWAEYGVHPTASIEGGRSNLFLGKGKLIRLYTWTE